MSQSDSTERIVRPPHSGTDEILLRSVPAPMRPLMKQLLDTDAFLAGGVNDISVKFGYMKREFRWVKRLLVSIFIPLAIIVYQQLTAAPPQVFHVQQPSNQKARTAPTSTPVSINDLFCEESGVSNGSP